MTEIIMIAYFIFVAFMLWVLRCNNRTGDDRQAIIAYVYRQGTDYPGPKFQHEVGLFNKVSYDRHLWYRVVFRDPKKLYGDLYPFKESV